MNNFYTTMRTKAETALSELERLEERHNTQLESVLVKPTLLTPELLKMLRIRVGLIREIEKLGLFCIRTAVPISKAQFEDLALYVHDQERARCPLFVEFFNLVRNSGVLDGLVAEKRA